MFNKDSPIMVKDLMNDLEKGGDRIKEHLIDKKVERPQSGFLFAISARQASMLQEMAMRQ